MLQDEFFLIPEEVFRLGNFNPKFARVRSKDADTITINGILMVIANGKGVSVFDRNGIIQSPKIGWVWRFVPQTALPPGLELIEEEPNHYCLAPTQNMPVNKYKGLLEELALKANRMFKKEGRLT